MYSYNFCPTKMKNVLCDFVVIECGVLVKCGCQHKFYAYPSILMLAKTQI